MTPVPKAVPRWLPRVTRERIVTTAGLTRR
jgi:hypothetical protein